MRCIISALLFCFSSAWAFAQDSKPLELAPDAPDRHIVVPGDTLWGIAAKFLKDPYRWPDVWRLNPDDIKNPQRIYPGQVIILDRSGDQPLLKLGQLVKVEPRIHVSEPPKEIPAIPPRAIEPFLSQPGLMAPESLDDTARIIAFKDDRLGGGAGSIIYVTKLKAGISRWLIMRPGKTVPDPDDADQTLGVEATYLGVARVIKEGQTATLEIVSSRQEITRNDYLIPAPRAEIINYAPHAPKNPVVGRIMSIYDGVGEAGPLSIIMLSRGKREGLEVGHVLALHRTGREIENPGEDKSETYKLPDERYGLVFVFRVLERISYGLILESSRSAIEGDTVSNP